MQVGFILGDLYINIPAIIPLFVRETSLAAVHDSQALYEGACPGFGSGEPH